MGDKEKRYLVTAAQQGQKNSEEESLELLRFTALGYEFIFSSTFEKMGVETEFLSGSLWILDRTSVSGVLSTHSLG